jgi:hypothetical protein
MRRVTILLPLICGVMLAAGLLIGVNLGSGSGNSSPGSPLNKVRAVLDFVDAHYVDTIDANALTDRTVEALLEQLDFVAMLLARSKHQIWSTSTSMAWCF